MKRKKKMTETEHKLNFKSVHAALVFEMHLANQNDKHVKAFVLSENEALRLRAEIRAFHSEGFNGEMGNEANLESTKFLGVPVLVLKGRLGLSK